MKQLEEQNRIMMAYIEAEKKAKEDREKAADEMYTVGSALNLEAVWNHGFWIQSPNKVFTLHIAGRLQNDTVFWNPSPALRFPATPVVVPGTGLGQGVQPLDDGSYFRRIRLETLGVLYELVEFHQEIDFEAGPDAPLFDHLYVGFRDLPYVGTVRFGQQKVPQGLESMSSSKLLPDLERSLTFESFLMEFAIGTLFANTYLNERGTWQIFLHRNSQFSDNFGSDFGDGIYVYTGRITGLPIYADGGRHLLHLGGSYQYRVGQNLRTVKQQIPLTNNPNVLVSPDAKFVRYRTRAEIRDSGETLGDSTRLVDTGFILADGASTLGAELLWIAGPLSIQSECLLSQVVNAQFPASFPSAPPAGDPFFWGGYVLISYFLTGENRGYDRRFGLYERPFPSENFFLVRNRNGGRCLGRGAWELTYRYSYVDLNDTGIDGGQMIGNTLGLNWYFNANFKVQLNLLNTSRNVVDPANSGTVNAAGIRFHVDW
ncbi:MAG: OprO/OprP family phosphate-selective porin [Gemmataceae bacterium]